MGIESGFMSPSVSPSSRGHRFRGAMLTVSSCGVAEEESPGRAPREKKQKVVCPGPQAH